VKDAKQPEDFLRTLRMHYEQHGRHDLPWRQPERDGNFDPYKILVSEMMLQQTQVPRVILKYQSFLRTFPSAKVLAAADLSAVLAAWQGLGYNRRAKYLWEAAKAVETAGRFPKNLKDLVALPGIEANTAGAIMAYAYNQPVGFVETNIRTVYIHHFTRDGQIVSDDFIRDLVLARLDQANPRDFYWALMDYGSYLKTTIRNNHQSRHYRKQSPFDGSRRQVRGQVLRLLQPQPLGRTTLHAHISDVRLDEVLAALISEGLVSYKDEKYRLG
jgi:A/G-specific adenine glycosylase